MGPVDTSRARARRIKRDVITAVLAVAIALGIGVTARETAKWLSEVIWGPHR